MSGVRVKKKIGQMGEKWVRSTAPAGAASVPQSLTAAEAALEPLVVAVPQEEPVLRQVMELKAGERELLYLIYYAGRRRPCWGSARRRSPYASKSRVN